jgi:hypothetical protein
MRLMKNTEGIFRGTVLIFISLIWFYDSVFAQYPNPIEFKPKSYVCYQADDVILIDGLDLEHSWQNTAWTSEFVDIEGQNKSVGLSTRVKMLWDAEYFYIYAFMQEPHVWGTLTDRDDVIYRDDDFEIFIDPDGDGHNYYELEINALNTLWDLILLQPYRNDSGPNVINDWNILNIKTAIHVYGTLNDPSDIDEGWSVEWAIPWSALKELAPRIPRDGDQWRVDFSRVDWEMDIVGGAYVKSIDPLTQKVKPEYNWVWSPTGFIAMHMPEMWGYVQFSKHKAGTKEVQFMRSPDELIKWNLWNMYWQQLNHFGVTSEYSDDLSLFKNAEIIDCPFDPHIYVTPHYFEIVASGCSGDVKYMINSEGRIIKLK